jgi:hypothetical protein
LNGVLIAHNGVGDHLLVLPDRVNPDVFSEMLFVMSHETAQVHILCWDIKTAVKEGLDGLSFSNAQP